MKSSNKCPGDIVYVNQKFEMMYKVKRKIAADVYFAIQCEFYRRIWPRVIRRALCDPAWRKKKCKWWREQNSFLCMRYFETAPVTKGVAE